MDISIASLDELRRRIDALDDRLHDLLMARAELVAGIARLKRSTGIPPLRPGREAQILRRLVARHRGPFPRQSLVRLWRELLGGMVTMQGGLKIAVTEQPGAIDLARDHFGGQVAITLLRSPAEVVAAVAAGATDAGVLPLPNPADPMPWWPALDTGAPGQGLRAIARLPLAGFGSARGLAAEALVIGKAELDPTGDDLTLLVIELRGDPGRARLSAALETTGVGVRCLGSVAPAPDVSRHLVEFDAPILPDDGRLAAALRPLGGEASRIRLVGLYARPLPPEPR